jgi:adenosine deaminase
VAAKDDPTLVEHLLKNNIAIEMCPVSNVRTKVVDDIRSHPIGPFFDRGLMVTVSSDDPTMFGTSMNNEYRTLQEELGFTLPELFRLSLNGIDSSFLDEDRKQSLKKSFYRSYKRLSQ